MKIKLKILISILIVSWGCQSQTETKMNDNKKNPLLCDPISGVCEIPGMNDQETVRKVVSENKPIKITYFTDPICSSCWGIEPQLRKMKLEYGDYIEIDYRMGGLLPDWSYNNGGISQPSDVAQHWEEASLYYQMPISGDVWIEDPLNSSYPPSIAFKAVQMQDTEKAVVFMRKLRELLFLDKKNITRWEVITEAAVYAGLDTFRLKEDFDGGAKAAFEEDLNYCRRSGVRRFPTLFLSDNQGNQITVYGSRPYEVFEDGINKLIPDVVKTKIGISSPLYLFEHYSTLTAKEYALLADVSFKQSSEILDRLTSEGKLEKQTIKTGSIYKIR